MADKAIIDFGDISKPATVFIEKISDAVGGVFRPYQVVRMAKAEAEAERISVESQIQVTDLQRRAMYRFLQEEAIKQSNIESITQQALPLLEDKSQPENVENDWIVNFFDKCRIISDQDMQVLWAKILAGQANSPGAFSKKTINLLADLDKADAELFTRLCGFGWMIEKMMPLVFDLKSELYNREEINFNSVSHLESLGLVQFNGLTGFVTILDKNVSAGYFGRLVELDLRADKDNHLDVGHVLLTRAGHELSTVCGSTPVEGFFEYVYAEWAQHGHVPKLAGETVSP